MLETKCPILSFSKDETYRNTVLWEKNILLSLLIIIYFTKPDLKEYF